MGQHSKSNSNSGSASMEAEGQRGRRTDTRGTEPAEYLKSLTAFFGLHDLYALTMSSHSSRVYGWVTHLFFRQELDEDLAVDQIIFDHKYRHNHARPCCPRSTCRFSSRFGRSQARLVGSKVKYGNGWERRFQYRRLGVRRGRRTARPTAPRRQVAKR